MMGCVEWRPLEVPPDLGGKGIHIGTSGYYYDDWIGIFNPPRLSAKKLALSGEEERADQDRLRFYQKYFSFVEINHTFYQEPTLAHSIDMEKRSRGGMLFAFKVHKDVSHTRACDAAQGREIMRRYITAVSPLVETGRFFSFLIQLEDRWYRTQERLDYLRAVCDEAAAMRIDVHVEFRHASWHTMHVLQSLKDAHIGICNTDIPAIRNAFPLKAYATTEKGYVRYSGRNLEHWYPKPGVAAGGRNAARNARYDYVYSAEELATFVTGQRTLMRKTASFAAAYNNHFQAKAIRNAMENIRMLRDALAAERV